MAQAADWVPAGVNRDQASIARVYDYLLGGDHNLPVDQELGRSLAAVDPNVALLARANRAFLRRAVRFGSQAGISQFLDIGSGIPTEGNVHEVAQQASPAARVVYADIDPAAVAHSRVILAGNPGAAIIEGDLRQPGAILGHPETRRLIDFRQPAGLLLVSVLPFVADAEDPWRIVATLRDALAPGSFIAVSHATDEGRPVAVQAMGKVYSDGVPTPGGIRSRAGIRRFFDGLRLVDPGLVNVPLWRPGAPADVPADPGRFWVLAGVGVQP
jgi:hypothetical protein